MGRSLEKPYVPGVTLNEVIPLLQGADGPGSGLDADKLNGVPGDQLLTKTKLRDFINIHGVTPIAQPVITSTALDSINKSITKSTYTTSPTFIGLLTGCDWELASDIDFRYIKDSSYNDGVNTTSWTPSKVTPNSTMYVRVRDRSKNYRSIWSVPIAITIGLYSAIEAPIISVSGGVNNMDILNLTITLSPYKVNNGFDPLLDVTWVIIDDSGLPIHTLNNSTTNTNRLNIPSDILKPNKNYLITVEYKSVSLDTNSTGIYVRTSSTAYLDNWNQLPDLPVSVSENTLVTLLDGSILSIGGKDNTGTILSSCFKLDILTKAWSVVSNYPVPVYSHSSSLLNDGSVLSCGGLTTLDAPLSSCYRYNNVANQAGDWTTLQADDLPTATPVYGHAQSTLNDGTVILSGGMSGATPVMSDVLYKYTPTAAAATQWSSVGIPVYPTTIAGHSQVTLNDGRVYISGGKDPIGVTNYVNILDLSLQTPVWDISPTNMLIPRFNHSTVVGADGLIYFVGGLTTTTGTVGTDIFTSYDILTDTWNTNLSTLPIQVYNNSITIDMYGNLVTSGGISPLANNMKVFEYK